MVVYLALKPDSGTNRREFLVTPRFNQLLKVNVAYKQAQGKYPMHSMADVCVT